MYEFIYRYRSILKRILSVFLVPLSALIIKNKNLILFHGSDLNRFSENGRYLFLYLHNNSSFSVVWLTSSKALQDELIRLGYHSEIHASLRGILCYLRAGCVVGSGSSYPDFAGSVGLKTIKLCLHHGSGPRTTNGLSAGNQFDFIKTVNEWDYFNFTSKWMSASVGKLQFFLPDNKRVLLGYPRCDHLLDPSHEKGDLHFQSLPTNFDIGSKSKIILFAPTWRQQSDFGWNTLEHLSGYSVEVLNSFLEAENMFIYVSLHPKSIPTFDCKWPDRIRLIEESLLYDVNEFLPYVDILITDYSSIATDFFLTGKRVVYCLPDYDFYLEHVGLLEPIRSFNPGIVVGTFKELMEALKHQDGFDISLFTHDLDIYLEKYYDKSLVGACERTYRFLKEVLQ